MAAEAFDNMQLIREVAGMSAKIDVMISQQVEMKQQIASMPTRPEVDARFEKQGERLGRAESRIRDLENDFKTNEKDSKGLFFRWAPIILSAVGVVIAVSTFFRAPPQPAISPQNQVHNVQTK